MKAILAFVGLFSASAMACPDISGTYVTADGVYLKYVQVGCTTLTRFLGEIDQHGKVTFPNAGMLFTLDGKPECTIRSFCTTATAEADVLRFESNYDANVNTDDHGSCAERQHTLTIGDNGNLIGSYKVFNCTDKFTGPAVKTFKKF